MHCAVKIGETPFLKIGTKHLRELSVFDCKIFDKDHEIEIFEKLIDGFKIENMYI